MTTDPVRWKNKGEGCSRCGVVAQHYVTPYWASPRRLCPVCCVELNRFHDRYEWPPVT